MIKGGCETLTQAKNLPLGALLLIQPAVVTALISQSNYTRALIEVLISP